MAPETSKPFDLFVAPTTDKKGARELAKEAAGSTLNQMANFGRLLSQRRIASRLSVSNVAKTTGINRRFLAEVEKGRRTIGGDYLIKLADALAFSGNERERFLNAGKATGWVDPALRKQTRETPSMSGSSRFGNLLHQYRTREKLTMRKLAELAGMPNPIIAQAEGGRRTIGQAYADQLATALRLKGRERDQFMIAALDTTLKHRALPKLTAYSAELFNWVPHQLEAFGIPASAILGIAETPGSDLAAGPDKGLSHLVIHFARDKSGAAPAGRNTARLIIQLRAE